MFFWLYTIGLEMDFLLQWSVSTPTQRNTLRNVSGTLINLLIGKNSVPSVISVLWNLDQKIDTAIAMY